MSVQTKKSFGATQGAPVSALVVTARLAAAEALAKLAYIGTVDNPAADTSHRKLAPASECSRISGNFRARAFIAVHASAVGNVLRIATSFANLGLGV